jgi:predicted nucleotide-binding protein
VTALTDFLRHPLKEALRVAEAIWKDNQGQPYDTIDLAKSLNTTPKSSAFIMLLTSSLRYGLTTGSYKSPKISLTALGSAIVAPTEGSNVNAKLRQALLTPELFQKVYTRLDRKIIPKEEVFKNTLVKEFLIPKDDVEICYEVIMQNITDYSLSQELKGNVYLQLNKLSEVTEETQKTEAGQDLVEETSPPEEIVPEPKAISKQIFVAHGKNKKPLEQLKAILTQFKVPFQVAIDEPHKGRAISEKVAQLMRECTSGIFIFTADEKTADAQNNEVWRPSDNVVFELGAGTVMYGKKIVIFREEGVSFGSDFTDYGHITFEKDKLDAKAFDLMKELIAQQFLQVNPT